MIEQSLLITHTLGVSNKLPSYAAFNVFVLTPQTIAARVSRANKQWRTEAAITFVRLNRSVNINYHALLGHVKTTDPSGRSLLATTGRFINAGYDPGGFRPLKLTSDSHLPIINC